MKKENTGQIILLLLAGAAIAAILVGFFILPGLLQNDSKLVSLPFTVAETRNTGDALFMRGSFQQDIPANERMWLYAENAEIQFCFAGKTDRYNEHTNTPALFRSPGSGWYPYDSPGVKAGDPVEFTVRSYYGKHDVAAEKMLTQLYMGDGGGLYRQMLGKISFFGFVQICALIAGMLYLVEGAVDILSGITASGTRICMFGFYCIGGGLWCMTDLFYPYFGLLISPPWVAAVFDMVGFLIFPIALSVMMRYYMRRNWTRKVMSGVVEAEVITAGICLIFQCFGVADLIEQQFAIGAVALIALGAAIVCIVVELRKYHDGYLLLLLLTMLPVFCTVTMDGVNILYPFMPQRTLMQYGFSISILLMLLQLVCYARMEFSKEIAMRRMENEVSDARVAIMLSQIQPHFLYNALCAIQDLCHGKAPEAEKATVQFSEFLRGNLDSLKEDRPISFEQELRHTQNYLAIEALRFGDRLTVVYNVEATKFCLPTLTLQPIVENAVRYGVSKKPEGGTVQISSRDDGDRYVVAVKDDGDGFDPLAIKKDGRTHIGIENVRNRLSNMCGGELRITSIPGMGTTVTITVLKEETI